MTASEIGFTASMWIVTTARKVGFLMTHPKQTSSDKLKRIDRRITIACVAVCLIAGTVALPFAGLAAAALGGGAALKLGLALAGGGVVALTTALIGHSLMKRAERTIKHRPSARCDCPA